MSTKPVEAASPESKRVYEYHDHEGHVYYSFYKSPHLISSPTRLKLRSRMGNHLINFLVAFRRIGDTGEGDVLFPGKVAAPQATTSTEPSHE